MSQRVTLVLGMLVAAFLGCGDDPSIEAPQDGGGSTAESSGSLSLPPEHAAAAETIEACATCHGRAGEGDESKFAPSLAGMPEWYLIKQMSMFIDGRREPLPDTGEGAEMVSMLRKLPPVDAMRAASYYSELPPIKLTATLGGDAKQGRSIYQGKGACINCHLLDGQGDQASGSPPITILPEWYFMRQMKAFRDGQRAAHTHDEITRCMVIAASRLNEQERKDVAAYVAELAAAQ